VRKTCPRKKRKGRKKRKFQNQKEKKIGTSQQPNTTKCGGRKKVQKQLKFKSEWRGPKKGKWYTKGEMKTGLCG